VLTALPRDAQLVVDLGGGTGYYLSAALDAVPAARGVCLDRSTAALRRAARAHPHGAAVGCDVWHGLPLGDGCADVVLDVFSPRNGAEIRRVLAPDGRLIVVTPSARHLNEIIEPLRMLSIDERKADRLTENLRDFSVQDRRTVEYAIELDRAGLVDLVSMGPAAWHSTPDAITHRAEQVVDPIRVTVSVDIATLGIHG
jgi:23S rRNA (guanine745-N1)-methyltransferase